MENPNNVKRSIRIPKELNSTMTVEAKKQGISVNKLILKILKQMF